MRAWLLVLVGCASQDPPLIIIDVEASPTGVYWDVSPGASCSCQNVATFPASGTCSHESDTPGCTCYPGACLSHVDLVQGNTVLKSVGLSTVPVPSTSDGFAADLTLEGLALRFSGCGADAVAPLPNAFPDAVTSMISSDRTQVTWSAVPNDGYLVTAAGEFTGELCRTERDATSQVIDLGYFTSAWVRAVGGPVSTSSGSFTFHVWATD